MLGFVVLTLFAYAAAVGLVLLINERLLGMSGFTDWPIAWFLWCVACWPGVAAGVIARWSGAASQRTLIAVHAGNAVLIFVLMELSYLLASDTPFYIAMMCEIVLVYVAISQAKK
ncbi:MAG: hypothetical protein IT430_00840 [Phycisphaerales bacterium]|nr:hypothetical protein [Phycisphaerales bacterium]